MLNDRITHIINETVKRSLNNISLRQKVRNIVSEEVYREIKNEEINEAKKKLKGQRSLVMKMLKDPKFDHADLAYALRKPKDDSERDTLRSWFSKCARGILKFSDNEITKLYNLMTTRK